MQVEQEAILFCEMFYGDPNWFFKSTFMNFDKYGEFIVNVLKK